jgi:Uncharacterized protein conserved in bacteria
MSNAIGRKRWTIAEGYIPAESIGGTRQLVSHETMCLLNVGDEDAHVEVRVYFVGAGRTLSVYCTGTAHVAPALQ